MRGGLAVKCRVKYSARDGYADPSLPRSRMTPVADRFWARVDKSGGPDACWPWTRRRDLGGYGVWSVKHKQVRAHRLAHELAIGPIPAGLVVMHLCDNKPCCNPAHLRAGTILENTRDAMVKGLLASGDRHGSRTKPHRVSRGINHPSHKHPELRQGERNGRAKLTEEDVRELRRLHDEEGWTKAALSRKYGIYDTAVGRIVKRILWASVAAFVLLLPRVARAQRGDNGLDLSIAGLHESGADVTSAELAAIWAVATRVPGRRRPLAAQMPRLFAGATPRAPALLRLTRRTVNPGLLAIADAVVDGLITHSCERRPDAWGGAMDRARARRLGFRRIDCGSGCRNDFYVWGHR